MVVRRGTAGRGIGRRCRVPRLRDYRPIMLLRSMELRPGSFSGARVDFGGLTFGSPGGPGRPPVLASTISMLPGLMICHSPVLRLYLDRLAGTDRGGLAGARLLRHDHLAAVGAVGVEQLLERVVGDDVALDGLNLGPGLGVLPRLEEVLRGAVGAGGRRLADDAEGLRRQVEAVVGGAVEVEGRLLVGHLGVERLDVAEEVGPAGLGPVLAGDEPALHLAAEGDLGQLERRQGLGLRLGLAGRRPRRRRWWRAGRWRRADPGWPSG